MTLKQQRFVKHYLDTGNATEAARRAGYKESSLTTIGTIAYENMQKPAIQKAIKDALIKAEITEESIILRLNELSSSAGKDSDKIRALENLAKYKELTGFRQNNQPNTLISGPISISFGQSPQMALPSHTDVIEGEIVG